MELVFVLVYFLGASFDLSTDLLVVGILLCANILQINFQFAQLEVHVVELYLLLSDLLRENLIVTDQLSDLDLLFILVIGQNLLEGFKALI